MDETRGVRLTVVGVDTQGEEISLSTRGELIDFQDAWALRYEETDITDMMSSQTLVQVEGQRVTVTRSGSLLSTLVFKERETFVGDYPTPMGSFQVRVLPSEVHIRRRADAGHIRIVYEINLSNSFSQSDEAYPRVLDIRFFPCRT